MVILNLPKLVATNPNASTEEQVLNVYNTKGALASLEIKKEKLSSSDSENEHEK